MLRESFNQAQQAIQFRCGHYSVLIKIQKGAKLAFCRVVVLTNISRHAYDELKILYVELMIIFCVFSQ